LCPFVDALGTLLARNRSKKLSEKGGLEGLRPIGANLTDLVYLTNRW
jgi:hypothetical protein